MHPDACPERMADTADALPVYFGQGYQGVNSPPDVPNILAADRPARMLFIKGLSNIGLIARRYALAGLAMILLLTGYFIYYQFKPDWNLKPIIDKYEKALESAENHS